MVILNAAQHVTFFLEETFPHPWQRKLAVALPFALTVSLGITVGMLNLISVQTTDRNRPIGVHIAPDIGHYLLPDAPPWTADVMLYTLVLASTVFLASLKIGFLTALRRISLEYACAMGLRGLTLVMTFPPDPSPYCQTAVHPKGTTCGDLIFSGHAITFMVFTFAVRAYAKSWWARAVTVSFCFTGLVAVVMSKLHYTRDVVTAVVVVLTIHHFMNVTIYRRPDTVLRHRLLCLFEADNYLFRQPFADGHLHNRVGEEEREDG